MTERSAFDPTDMDCHRREMAARGQERMTFKPQETEASKAKEAEVCANIRAAIEAKAKEHADEEAAYAVFVRNVEARLRFFVRHGASAGPAPISLLERAADILAKIHPGPAELKKSSE